MYKLYTLVMLAILAAFSPAGAEPQDWVDSTLRCDVKIDNQCLKAIHRQPHDYAERARRARAREETNAIRYRLRFGNDWERQEELRREEIRREEARRLERREEHREAVHELRAEERGRVQVTRYREKGRDVEVRTYARTACLPPIRRVGTEHMAEANAKAAANNAWSEEVRYRHGERWMDVSAARNLRHTCSQSSIAEGVVNKLESYVGAVKMRCEVEAEPCLPLPVATEK